MTRSTLVAVAVAVALAAPALAREAVRNRDIRALQDEMSALGEALDALPESHARAQEFRDRAIALQEDVIWLKVEMRRNRAQRAEVRYDEVEGIREDIASLRTDIEIAGDQRATGDVTLPEGTEIEVRLETALSSKTARLEDRVEASVSRAVRLNGRVAIPVGATARGVVADVQSADRLSRGGRLTVDFDRLSVERQDLDLRAAVVSVKGETDKGQTGKRAGIGAVLGGVLGGILEGKSGAIIGAVIGAGGAVAASKGEDVELPEGTVMVLRLERPLRVPRR